MIRILSIIPFVLLGTSAFAACPEQKPNSGYSCIENSAGTIQIENIYALPTSEAAKNGAVFMTIKNTGLKDRLTDVRSPIAEKVEMHTMTMENDVMKMREIGALDLTSETKLEPSGNHIMLIGLKQPLKEGESFPLTLDFDVQADVTLDVPVKMPEEKPADEETHHHH